jgi:hypothetical protein
LGKEHIEQLQSSLESELTKAFAQLSLNNVQLSAIIDRCIRDSLFPQIPFSSILESKGSISEPILQANLEFELSRSFRSTQREDEPIAFAIFMNMEEPNSTPISSETVTDDEDDEQEEIGTHTVSLSTASEDDGFVFEDIYFQQISPGEFNHLFQSQD